VLQVEEHEKAIAAAHSFTPELSEGSKRIAAAVPKLGFEVPKTSKPMSPLNALLASKVWLPGKTRVERGGCGGG